MHTQAGAHLHFCCCPNLQQLCLCHITQPYYYINVLHHQTILLHNTVVALNKGFTRFPSSSCFLLCFFCHWWKCMSNIIICTFWRIKWICLLLKHPCQCFKLHLHLIFCVCEITGASEVIAATISTVGII